MDSPKSEIDPPRPFSTRPLPPPTHPRKFTAGVALLEFLGRGGKKKTLWRSHFRFFNGRIFICLNRHVPWFPNAAPVPATGNCRCDLSLIAVPVPAADHLVSPRAALRREEDVFTLSRPRFFEHFPRLSGSTGRTRFDFLGGRSIEIRKRRNRLVFLGS